MNQDRCTFFVPGRPAPKGSYRAVNTARGLRFLPQSEYEKTWRETVRIFSSRCPKIQGKPPIKAKLTFFLDKPKTVKRTHPTVPPDLDKLIRSTLDGIVESGLIRDDSQITHLEASKSYTQDNHGHGYKAGCIIHLKELSGV